MRIRFQAFQLLIQFQERNCRRRPPELPRGLNCLDRLRGCHSAIRDNFVHGDGITLHFGRHRPRIFRIRIHGHTTRVWSHPVPHLSAGCNQLLISGGDRHGCEPNAALNLTKAASFTEFVHQVRKERISHILFMPQYTESRTLRMLQTLLDAIREYPDYSSGCRQWDERVFHPDHAGVIRPLPVLWEKPPFYILHFFSVVRLLEKAAVRRALQLTLARPQRREHLRDWLCRPINGRKDYSVYG